VPTHSPGEPAGQLRRRVLAAALAAYSAFVLVVTLSPRMPGTGSIAILVNGVLRALHERGLFVGVEYDHVEFLANLGMFVPLGALAVLVKRAWLALLLGPAFSGFIELYQSLLLPGRVGELRDVLSNSAGFLLGAGVTLWILALREREHRPRADREHEAHVLHRGDALLEHDRREDYRAGGVQRGEHGHHRELTEAHTEQQAHVGDHVDDSAHDREPDARAHVPQRRHRRPPPGQENEHTHDGEHDRGIHGTVED
jgi:hypothetical protein